jgi:sugar (pentulose or hexulose) kinase
MSPPTRDCVLAIDHGTQSVRALLFDVEGRLVARASVPVAYDAPDPAWTEQDPEYFWRAVGDACRALWAASPVPASAVRGVALTTQRGTVVNLDAERRPLRPAIVWPDRRRTEGLRPVGGLWGIALRLAGVRETVAFFQAEAEANWIARHQPDVWARTRHYLLLSGWLTFKLTGRVADSVASQVGYVPFDFKGLRWAPSWDWKWQVAPFVRETLPELVPPGTVIGEVTREASEATGIPAGTRVVAAAADKACEVLGAGALEPHVGCLSYGTLATFNTTQRKYVEAVPLVPPYPAAVPGAYSLELQVTRGYWMVSWFREQFGHPERERARALGIEPEVLLDDLVRQVPAGSDGLMLQPYWSPGIRLPGPEARGAMIGFSDVHGRAHVYRAMLEGLAYALREAKERSDRRTGIPVTDLRVAGGGARSDVVMQLTADVFGMPAARPACAEASGLGAAICATVGLGLHADFDAAVRAMTRRGTTFEPDATTHERYERLYRDVYLKMYPRLKPLYQRLRGLMEA